VPKNIWEWALLNLLCQATPLIPKEILLLLLKNNNKQNTWQLHFKKLFRQTQTLFWPAQTLKNAPPPFIGIFRLLPLLTRHEYAFIIIF